MSYEPLSDFFVFEHYRESSVLSIAKGFLNCLWLVSEYELDFSEFIFQPLLERLLRDVGSHMLEDDSSFVIFIVQYDKLLPGDVRPHDYFAVIKKVSFLGQNFMVCLQVAGIDRAVSLILLRGLPLIGFLRFGLGHLYVLDRSKSGEVGKDTLRKSLSRNPSNVNFQHSSPSTLAGL